jgi:hypothetical protein
MADSNHNADFNPTTSTAEYFGLHPDLNLTAAEEAAIMPEVDASMNRRDTISPKVGTQANTLTENNCGKLNFHRFADRCLTRGLRIRVQLRLLQLRCIWS